MSRMSKSEVVTLPKGKYFIGDPGYAVTENWDEFCDKSFEKETMSEYKDTPMFCHSTAYGDGVYRGSNKFKYGVDAGIIGAVPMSLVTETDGKELKRLGTITNFPKAFEVYFDNGVFYIGHIEIDTN